MLYIPFFLLPAQGRRGAKHKTVVVPKTSAEHWIYFKSWVRHMTPAPGGGGYRTHPEAAEERRAWRPRDQSYQNVKQAGARRQTVTTRRCLVHVAYCTKMFEDRPKKKLITYNSSFPSSSSSSSSKSIRRARSSSVRPSLGGAGARPCVAGCSSILLRNSASSCFCS